jgi:membrane protein YdbS with pleckstrin-like domain
MWMCSDGLRALPVMVVLVLGNGPWNWWDLPTWLLVVVGVVLLALVLGVPQWRYAVHRWEVTETAVYTQTGWWARERRIAPMSRVQTVDHRGVRSPGCSGSPRCA